MHKNNQSCLVGATYEHQFESLEPIKEQAIAELFPKASHLYPPLKNAEI